MTSKGSCLHVLRSSNQLRYFWGFQHLISLVWLQEVSYDLI